MFCCVSHSWTNWEKPCPVCFPSYSSTYTTAGLPIELPKRKVKRWVNLYFDGPSSDGYVFGYVHETKTKADSARGERPPCIACVEIEVEE